MTPTISESFQNNLRWFRKETPMTQAELAKLCGTTPAHIGHLERGDRDPSMSLLNRLMKVLRVQPGELLVNRKQTTPGNDGRLRAINALLENRTQAELDKAEKILRVLFVEEQ